MPDAHIPATVPYPLVERHPSRPMLLVPTARVRFQVLKRPPILNDDSKALDVPKEAALRVRFQFLQHPRHREKHGQPLVNHPWLIDAHPNQEDHEVSFDLRRHSARNHLRHISPRAEVPTRPEESQARVGLRKKTGDRPRIGRSFICVELNERGCTARRADFQMEDCYLTICPSTNSGFCPPSSRRFFGDRRLERVVQARVLVVGAWRGRSAKQQPVLRRDAFGDRLRPDAIAAALPGASRARCRLRLRRPPSRTVRRHRRNRDRGSTAARRRAHARPRRGREPDR